MATIVATLNAASPGTQADNVTTDVNLTYKVYNDTDSYAVAETFGKHGTTGVTVSAGVVTITGVTEPSGVTAYKISSVDEAGNEAILSPASGTSIIELHETFAGTSLPANWTLTNPNPSATFDFSVADELTLGGNNATTTGYLEDFMKHSLAIDITREVTTIQIDVVVPTDGEWHCSFGFMKADGNVDGIYFLSKDQGTPETWTCATVQDSTTQIASTDPVFSATTKKSLKLYVFQGNVGFQYWSGSAWLPLQAGATPTSALYGTWYPFISTRGFDNTGEATVTDLYVTNGAYTTQYPV